MHSHHTLTATRLNLVQNEIYVDIVLSLGQAKYLPASVSSLKLAINFQST